MPLFDTPQDCVETITSTDAPEKTKLNSEDAPPVEDQNTTEVFGNLKYS